jgi:hypothetical protein
MYKQKLQELWVLIRQDVRKALLKLAAWVWTEPVTPVEVPPAPKRHAKKAARKK